MNKDELEACRNVIDFSIDLNNVLATLGRLIDENEKLKEENAELKKKLKECSEAE
jgi:regulator of replication initiation timing